MEIFLKKIKNMSIKKRIVKKMMGFQKKMKHQALKKLMQNNLSFGTQKNKISRQNFKMNKEQPLCQQ